VAPSAIIPANDRDRQELEIIEAKGLVMETSLLNAQPKQAFRDERKEAQHIFTAHVLEIAGSFAVPNAALEWQARSLGWRS
jgi:hypothetical protein